MILRYFLTVRSAICHFERSEAESRNLPDLTQVEVLQIIKTMWKRYCFRVGLILTFADRDARPPNAYYLRDPWMRDS